MDRMDKIKENGGTENRGTAVWKKCPVRSKMGK
jgi:hypothetical protein